jgi:uncharacterized membrane protein
MDKFREQLKVRTNWLTTVAAVTLLIYVGLLYYRDRLSALPDFIQGFQTGIMIGLELAVIAFIVKYMRALKNDTALKKLYIKERDERSGQILQSACTYTIVVAIVGLALASVVASFFNTVVFFTLVAALVFILVLFYTLMIVYSKKI